MRRILNRLREVNWFSVGAAVALVGAVALAVWTLYVPALATLAVILGLAAIVLSMWGLA